MERKDELTILGKTTAYKQDYAPEVLEAFVNKHPENVSTARNLQACAPLPANPILRKSASATCRM